ncbi:efflux RND transporter permease subunit [Roseivirga sp. BDSF3-8]|uniref:efflux RND transporter permease subunit n=1 Tax=Roseivirga sp. BDSF3-8 TaxID=3241598 RepID=UPI003531EDEC
MLNSFIRFFLHNKLVTVIILVALTGWGLSTAPFTWPLEWLPRDPVPVDAIPNIGENQQIVFTEWPGRSPQDVDDQITYPLTTAMLGIPGVKTVRSTSMFGFSSIYIIFEEDIEFYWSRSRILEKINALPPGVLPDGVQPVLGPDATALGQIFWYTLEGRDEEGNPTGGWDLQELRSIQDYYVRYALNSAGGVSEVASIGGYVQEYQVDVDPDKLQAYDITLDQVVASVRGSNLDVGAKTIEVNNVEYFIRGLGYVKNLEDLEQSVVAVSNNTPVKVADVARVMMGPAARRGILDKGGAEVVGGVVVAREGANPLEAINNVKAKIEEIAGGLPTRVLDDGTVSKVTVVPFYDRTTLIKETLGTLEEALTLEILITIIVVIIMVVNLRASVLISGLLPVAVLMCFIAMRYFGVDANIVALSGIAIAIGTMVDMGIILTENILRHKEQERNDESGTPYAPVTLVYRAATEVAPAILTAIATTIISFIPVFVLEAAEGKLFRPLAWTKTFALVAAVLVTLVFIPAFAQWLFFSKSKKKNASLLLNAILAAGGMVLLFMGFVWAGLVLIAIGGWNIYTLYDRRLESYRPLGRTIIVVIAVSILLCYEWLPLGPSVPFIINFILMAVAIGALLGLFYAVIYFYRPMLMWCLRNKALFLSIPTFLIIWGAMIWLGFNTLFGFIAKGFDVVGVNIRTSGPWSAMVHTFPGIGEEFMPSLDEGAFLLMPTSMPHSGVEYNKETLRYLDMAVASIPEVEEVVGKLGRVNSALDPAPISMFENVIIYKAEYAMDEDGHRMRFRTDDEGRFMLKDSTYYDPSEGFQVVDSENLIPDSGGEYLRQWRDGIQSPDDIWDEIVMATKVPGVTSAPKLQPIETRLVMLQTGMRAPMGLKIKGPDLRTIETFGFELEKVLMNVPSIKKETVFAERMVGKPYLTLEIDRQAIARYGLTVQQLQKHIEVAVGGMALTSTVEGRERYPVRVRYPRELRDNPESLREILIPTPTGAEVPLGDLVTMNYVKGPQMIRSEDTFLIGYVLFDRQQEFAEVSVVEDARRAIQARIADGRLKVPEGVSFEFAGSYENQVRAEKRLSIIVPLVLALIFLLLYLQFRSVAVTGMVFSGIAVAFAGGFIMLWFYGQPWFADFSLAGQNMRDLFQMGTVNLSVAVWVGFIALFGIATDDGVVMATYLQQVNGDREPEGRKEVHEAVAEAGSRRIRPCLMTTATTLLALLPVLTSTGRGSDIMVPMAIPSFGGMAIELITLFVVPVLYAMYMERKVKKSKWGAEAFKSEEK